MGAMFLDSLRSVHRRWSLRLSKACYDLRPPPALRTPSSKPRSVRRLLLAAVIAVVVVCSERRASTSLSTAPTDASCEGDAACCARVHAAPGRPHRIVNFTLPRALATPADGPRTWRVALAHAEPPAAARLNARIVRVVRSLRAAGLNATLLDLGAGAGRLSLAAAVAGYSVVSVEAIAGRVAALRHSLCLAPSSVRARVTLRAAALGARDDNPRVGPRVRSVDGMVAAGEVSLAAGDKVVVNVDAAGFEPFVVEGARKLLEDVYPSAVFAEYCPRLMGEAARGMGVPAGEAGRMGERFVGFMKKVGYRVFAMYKAERTDRLGQVYEAVFIHKG